LEREEAAVGGAVAAESFLGSLRRKRPLRTRRKELKGRHMRKLAVSMRWSQVVWR